MEAPEYYMGAVSASAQFTQEKRFQEQKPGENFTVDDLLDFPNDDTLMTDGFFDNIAVNSTDSSTVTVLDSCCNSSNSNNDPQFSGHFLDSQFSGDLCVPLDEMAELEWLSNFTEDSFSSQELQNLHLISGGGTALTTTVKPESSSSENHPEMARNNTIFNPETPLPGKARSKRSRAAPCDWSTRVLHVPESTMTKTTSSFSKKRENSISNSDGVAGVVRKCLHCAAEKTPQWRTGPMGPKTLCNACGVRYKSGRLVPEYRPAASPTFVSAKHSNSHRKVLELRRQKEFSRHHQHQHHQQQQHMLNHHSSIFGLSNGGNAADDYLIHHHHHHAGSTDFRHMI